jgi:hypothetical protein
VVGNSLELLLAKLSLQTRSTTLLHHPRPLNCVCGNVVINLTASVKAKGYRNTYHFNHCNISVYSQTQHKLGKVALELQRIVVDLGSSVVFMTDDTQTRDTVNTRKRQPLHTLSAWSKNASRISIPPSCTTHHTSIVPFTTSWDDGNCVRLRGMTTASCRAEATRMASTNHLSASVSRHLSGKSITTVLGRSAPSPAPATGCQQFRHSDR